MNSATGLNMATLGAPNSLSSQAKKNRAFQYHESTLNLIPRMVRYLLRQNGALVYGAKLFFNRGTLGQLNIGLGRNFTQYPGISWENFMCQECWQYDLVDIP